MPRARQVRYCRILQGTYAVPCRLTDFSSPRKLSYRKANWNGSLPLMASRTLHIHPSPRYRALLPHGQRHTVLKRVLWLDTVETCVRLAMIELEENMRCRWYHSQSGVTNFPSVIIAASISDRAAGGRSMLKVRHLPADVRPRASSM